MPPVQLWSLIIYSSTRSKSITSKSNHIIMFAVITTLAVLVAATVVSASPLARATCGTETYGPFKLYAKQQGSSDSQLVRLVNMGEDSNNNTISTMTVRVKNFRVQSQLTTKTSGMRNLWKGTRSLDLDRLCPYSLLLRHSRGTGHDQHGAQPRQSQLCYWG